MTGSSPADRSARAGRLRARGPLAGAFFAAALLVVPMAVIPGEDLTVVSLWGFLNITGAAGTGGASGVGDIGSVGDIAGYPVWRYFLDQPRAFSSLPPSIRAWPLAIGFHLLAAGSAISGVVLGREDRRVTGGLLALAAAASLWVSVGLALRFGIGTTAGWLTVIPVGALATAAVAIGVYGGDLRGIVDA
ncbi:TIGR04206 family protein [Halorubrum laminariae]|uniref:TIGR04206 family protein n=1 Tax=Halorubrum laminariae TaxID=1433523 RepID=A0ABD6C3X0_9EURY|nr:TIGR04206 family protein [Halorubrum laminariae]